MVFRNIVTSSTHAHVWLSWSYFEPHLWYWMSANVPVLCRGMVMMTSSRWPQHSRAAIFTCLLAASASAVLPQSSALLWRWGSGCKKMCLSGSTSAVILGHVDCPFTSTSAHVLQIKTSASFAREQIEVLKYFIMWTLIYKESTCKMKCGVSLSWKCF